MAKTHARHSPSKLDALSMCIRFKYKERTDDSADEGAMLHRACETGNVTGLTEQQKLDVMMARSYADMLVAAVPSEWVVFREPKLTLGELTYGHADFVAYNSTRNRIVVADYKFTRVDTNHRFQVMTYGAAFVHMLCKACQDGTTSLELSDDHGRVLGQVPVPEWSALADTNVDMHVIAPRIGSEPDVVQMNAMVLMSTAIKDIEQLYARIDDPFLPPTPDESVCGNCARAAGCPALNQVVAHAATGILGLPVPSVFAPGNSEVSARDRALAQVLRGVFDNWGEQIGKMNTEFVKSGGEIPGFRLQSRSNGVKVNPWATQTAIVALRSLGYTDEELLAACTLSVSALAKHKAETSALTEGEAKDQIRQVLGDLATESTSTFLAKVKRTKDSEMVTALLTQGEHRG